MCAVDIWKTTPFVALLLLAGLQVIPKDLYEAADVDGASKLQQFWKITLPLLRPAILVVLIFRTLDALRVFDVFYVFFGSRLDTQTMAIYDQSTIVGDGYVGYGAAVSVAIFLIIALFVVIYVTFMRVTGGDMTRRRAETAKRRGRSRVRSAGAGRGGRAPIGRDPVKTPFSSLVVLIFVYALFPFLLGDPVGVHAGGDLFSTPLQYIPTHPTLDNFREALSTRLLPARAAQLHDRRRAR